jgi:hypothetical protein
MYTTNLSSISRRRKHVMVIMHNKLSTLFPLKALLGFAASHTLVSLRLICAKIGGAA